jgi:osmoprotectant transport system permease protein
MSLLANTWDAFQANEGWERVIEHVKLSAVPLAIAGAIGLVLGIACAKGGPVGSFAVSTTGIAGRLIPTFAAMALVMALTSVGFWPAVVGLTLLGIPPVLLNVASGIQLADRGAVEAARGMGYTRTQLLRNVELPLAVPFVFTGLRTAAVMIVSTAALAGAIGAGGLGVTIIAGFSNNQDDVLLAGAIPVTLLALAAEGILVAFHRLITPTGLRRSRRQARLTGSNA